ncbi:phage capsid protein, partial [Acinetobacter baumannii]|nr:phage capsid protein [Acinetobacter baumannii]
TLAEGNVPEGEVIPLSKVERKIHSEKKIELKKYRKATTGEDIQMYGSNEAVTNTDNALVRQLQKKIRTDFVTALKTGTGTQDALGAGLQ